MSEQRAPEPFRGRPLLKLVGLNIAEILATAAGRRAVIVDANNLKVTVNCLGEERVSGVFEGIFHADGDQNTVEGDDKYRDWRDLGDEDDTE